MKQKIVIIDKVTKPGKTIITIKENDVTIRNIDHLHAQQTYKAHVFKPKKGKGSFSRHKKYKENYYEY